MTNTYIALLRAVNVGGANHLSMKDFMQLLEQLKLKEVKTYIQSGNAVFCTQESNQVGLAEKIKSEIKCKCGFVSEVIVLKLNELKNAITSNPYSEADADPKSLHLLFLTSAPQSYDLEKIDSIRAKTEQLTLKGKILYFYAPEGIGRSKLFSQIERLLSVAGTARNWRTVCKLLEMGNEKRIS